MKKDRCEIILVLDESGSMYGCRKTTIKGVNDFLDNQKRITGEVFITLVKFSESRQLVNDAVPLDQVEYLNENNYTPSFMTALLDAVGKTIDNVGKRLSVTPEDQRPEKVIFAVITDGYENASVSYSRKRVFDMVTHQRTRYNWEFIFLGADIDAWGEEIGIPHNVSMEREDLPRSFKGMSLFALTTRIGKQHFTTKEFFLPEEEMDKRLNELE